MPLQLLNVPSDSNQFFSAISLSLLLPVMNQDDQFDQAVECLFGHISRRASSVLIQELENYTVNTFPHSLSKLINIQLRPKVVAYILQHQSEFIDLASSPQDFAQRVESINNPNTPVGALEIKAMSAMVDVDVRIHQTSIIPDHMQHSNPSSRDMLHLSCINGVYQYFINPDKLPEAMRQQLFPLIPKQSTTLPEIVDLDVFQRAKSKQLLENMLTVAPTHINNISQHVAARPEYDELMAPSPADARFFLRFDPKQELKIIRASMEQVRLTLGYDLCLMTSDGCQEKRMLYIKIDPDEFSYTIKADLGNLHMGKIKYSALEHAFTFPVTIEQLRLCLPKILKITGELEHTLIQPVEIGGMRSWVSAMLKSGSIGMVSGTAAVGAVTIIGEFGIAAGVGIAAIPYAGLPIGLGLLMTTIIGAVFGKHFAIKYEGALEEANKLLSEGRFGDAVVILDREFNRWTLGTRELFLSSEHQVIAHYFRAICAEQLNINNDDAYIHYQQAYKAALRAKKPFAQFISKLQLLRLLKNSPLEQLPVLINREQEINNIITELTKDFTNGFTELYWNVLNKLTFMANRFRTFEPLSAGEIKSANTFLLVQDFYILKYYGTGFGSFLEIIGTFFQGAILGVFGHMSTDYLDKRTKDILVCEFPRGTQLASEKLENVLALMKFEQVAKLLKRFKQENQTLIRGNIAISSAITFIETFIIKYGAIWINTVILTLEKYHNLVQVLGIENQHAQSILSDTQLSIQFLAQIQRDFGLCFETEEDWLNALLAKPSQIAHLISPRTGDSMLHVLVKFRSMNAALLPQLKSAALHLKELRYVRNHQRDTPFALLQEDPYQLKDIIYSESLVKTGDELERVEIFLNSIKANPEKDSHFLLLDGPPGTGKTSAVLTHLKNLGYPVHEWMKGAVIDGVVGGLLTRVEKFFKDAKAAVTTNTLQVMFIDEIDGVLPKVTGEARDGYHSTNSEVTAFQTEISKLKHHRVVLIGTTNYPARIPKPVVERAATNRIHFSLPNEDQRRQLLNHFFRAKRISVACIDTLVTISVGYSPRQLQSFVDSIIENDVTVEMMTNYFNACARTIGQDFHEEFNCATLFMPSFEQEGELGNLFSSNLELEEQLVRLQCDASSDPRKHTLLYGPPGGGKTTAVRVFAQTSGRVLIAIQADHTTEKEKLSDLFARAKQLGRVIIFFDEMDRVAKMGSPHTAFLQTEMDGIIANDITVIGATNYPERFEPAIMSRFTSKILLPKLSEAALNKPIKKMLLESITKYGSEVYFDEVLATEMNEGATELGHMAEGLDLRIVNAAIALLMGDLTRQKSGNLGITYLRFQDVCFSMYLKKIQENIVERPRGNALTCTQYIRDNRNSFFPNTIPLNSIPASMVLMRSFSNG